MTTAVASVPWEGQLYSNGWRSAAGGTVDALDKSGGERIATVGLAGAVDVAQAVAPFGGMGASGNGGRFGTLANVQEFTQWHWCTIRDMPEGFAF